MKPEQFGEILNTGTPGPYDVYFETGLRPIICTFSENANGRTLKNVVVTGERSVADLEKIVLCVNLAPLLSELWKQIEDYETYVRFDFGGKWAPIREALAALAAFEVEHGC
jgi:hypothetical protein